MPRHRSRNVLGVAERNMAEYLTGRGLVISAAIVSGAPESKTPSRVADAERLRSMAFFPGLAPCKRADVTQACRLEVDCIPA